MCAMTFPCLKFSQSCQIFNKKFRGRCLNSLLRCWFIHHFVVIDEHRLHNSKQLSQCTLSIKCLHIAVWLSLLLCLGAGAEYCDQLVRLSVCLCICLSVCEHIYGPAGPIFTNFFAQIPCGCSSVLLRRRCVMLCTSGFTDDVTFGRNGSYGDAWNFEPLTYYH